MCLILTERSVMAASRRVCKQGVRGSSRLGSSQVGPSSTPEIGLCLTCSRKLHQFVSTLAAWSPHPESEELPAELGERSPGIALDDDLTDVAALVRGAYLDAARANSDRGRREDWARGTVKQRLDVVGRDANECLGQRPYGCPRSSVRMKRRNCAIDDGFSDCVQAPGPVRVAWTTIRTPNGSPAPTAAPERWTRPSERPLRMAAHTGLADPSSTKRRGTCSHRASTASGLQNSQWPPRRYL
jgi:hypothetical protein